MNVTAPRIPVSTYRLQFNSSFRFTDARSIVSYLRTLGITDCYASSYLKAVPGSGHGYDIADPTRLNPEIGSDEDYWAWIDELRRSGMSHILDVVPNHMGIAKSSNPWWQDVLENGPSSRFAHFFDIEWRPVKDELADKVLIPILGDHYGAVLERQELTLTYQDGAFVVRYADNWLPIAPDSYGVILTNGFDEWLAHEQGVQTEDVEEWRSIVTATEHLPSRSTRDVELIAVRAREKEVVKRRLLALLSRSEPLSRFVDVSLTAFNGRKGQPDSFDRLDDLLNRQSYRLADWRVASEEINYRRFFDVNQLAALRMEDPSVFEEVHKFAFELVAKGATTGLRVDHVDGLFAPGAYLNRLQERGPLFLVVEKILGADEQLSPEWPVHGTTGYEFAAAVNNLFVDSRSERAFDGIYARFLHAPRPGLSYDDLVYASKKMVMHETMSGDINSLGHQLNRFSERNRHFRDFTLYSLISTLKEIIACFPVYRTYLTEGNEVSPHDRRYLNRAIQCAKRRSPTTGRFVLDFIEQVLLKQTPAANADECAEQARFVGKFQQITSPVAAKGIEDTALYNYNRLLSLNDVGSDPKVFGMQPGAVHQWMIERRQNWPFALSTTGTHDSKRGEDVRARLNVLSEMPGEWKHAVSTWRALNRRAKRELAGAAVPDPNEEYFLYQTLVGAWPFADSEVPCFIDRLKKYIVKATREAKVHTSWLAPDEAYEQAIVAFIDDIVSARRPFLGAFKPFQSRVAELGIINSLAQLVVKITAPGVPDFYQGSEFWDLSLVDPDNRRRVDYQVRAAALLSLPASPDAASARALLEARADGRVKLFTMTRALCARNAAREVFERGSYLPLRTEGNHASSLFAFARTLDDGRAAITCIPRLVTGCSFPPLGAPCWEDTRVRLPESLRNVALRNAFTNETLAPHELALDAASMLASFPVALLLAA